MLIKFSVQNMLSFNEETELNMVAAPAVKEHKNHLANFTKPKEFSLLRGAAIYGANASGKSNIVKAIKESKDFILGGTKDNSPVALRKFALDPEMALAPIKINFVFSVENRIYDYGFVAVKDNIIEEWLYTWTSSKESLLFNRTLDKAGEPEIKIGKRLSGNNDKIHKRLVEYIAPSTKHHQLFLSKAFEDNVVDVLSPIIDWFEEGLTIIAPTSDFAALEPLLAKKIDFCAFEGGVLNNADTGITKLSCEEKATSFEEAFSGLPIDKIKDLPPKSKSGTLSVVTLDSKHGKKKVYIDEHGKVISYNLIFHHTGKRGNTVEFNKTMESDGTLRLMNVAPVLFSPDNQPRVYIIDELDRSLHPLLTKYFINLFFENDKLHNCQLIFTTHEDHLLDMDLLRRDEIFFVEKDREGASHISSLTDHKPIPRKDNKIRTDYIDGKYGAIPFLGDPKKLGLAPEAKPKKKASPR